jgi:O-acetyl-ADP-ribose deacetylase (regulator of RNase III)
MRVAESLHLRSIAFPAISRGIYRYPTQEAAEVAIVAVLTSMPSTQHLRQVIFSLFDKPTFDAFLATALAQRDEVSGEPYPCEIETALAPWGETNS